MIFVLIALVGMYPGRRIGWMLSRAVLYSAPMVIVVIFCVAWGALAAYLIHLLITWRHPHWVLKWIFGFALGAYVSIPNYGLLNEDTIPDREMPRHSLISHLPYVCFIISSIAFAYWL